MVHGELLQKDQRPGEGALGVAKGRLVKEVAAARRGVGARVWMLRTHKVCAHASHGGHASRVDTACKGVSDQKGSDSMTDRHFSMQCHCKIVQGRGAPCTHVPVHLQRAPPQAEEGGGVAAALCPHTRPRDGHHPPGHREQVDTGGGGLGPRVRPCSQGRQSPRGPRQTAATQSQRKLLQCPSVHMLACVCYSSRFP